MDTLTGWTQKLVEVHDNAPPTDVRAFMEEVGQVRLGIGNPTALKYQYFRSGITA